MKIGQRASHNQLGQLYFSIKSALVQNGCAVNKDSTDWIESLVNMNKTQFVIVIIVMILLYIFIYA